MTKIVATFSNGFTDTYNGHREVKAAWMLTRKDDGKVIASGHSMDADKARKTAMGNARISPSRFSEMTVPRADGKGRNNCPSYLAERAKRCGFKNHREHLAAYRADVSRALLNCQLEVIAL